MPDLKTLRESIGLIVEHHGRRCVIVEVLDEGPTLVVQCRQERDIQADQFGNAKRRVPPVHHIPVFNEDGTSLHPDYEALGLPKP